MSIEVGLMLDQDNSHFLVKLVFHSWGRGGNLYVRAADESFKAGWLLMGSHHPFQQFPVELFQGFLGVVLSNLDRLRLPLHGRLRMGWRHLLAQLRRFFRRQRLFNVRFLAATDQEETRSHQPRDRGNRSQAPRSYITLSPGARVFSCTRIIQSMDHCFNIFCGALPCMSLK